MRPWEDKNTIEIFSKMSANKSLKYACDLIKFSLKILISSIKEEHPDWKEWQIKKEIERVLYEE